MTSGTVDVLKLERHGSVLVMHLNRPDNGNRITEELAVRIVRELEVARLNRSLSGLVLTGNGSVFCVGGDYLSAGRGTEGRLGFARAFGDIERAMSRLGKPLVAAINGDAHAGGFSLLTACDLAVASDAATFGLPEVNHGLFPFLALAIVKDSLPKKILFDMVYTGRLLSALEALHLNLINEIVATQSVLARAIEIAECTSTRNPDIIGLGRDLYYDTRCTGPGEAVAQSRFALVAALTARSERR